MEGSQAYVPDLYPPTPLRMLLGCPTRHLTSIHIETVAYHSKFKHPWGQNFVLIIPPPTFLMKSMPTILRAEEHMPDVHYLGGCASSPLWVWELLSLAFGTKPPIKALLRPFQSSQWRALFPLARQTPRFLSATIFLVIYIESTCPVLRPSIPMSFLLDTKSHLYPTL